MSGTQDGPRRARSETREELVARVIREQAALHPAPVYSEAAKRRVRRALWAAWPVGLAVGLAVMWAVGWRLIEGIGFGVAFAVALWYLGLVLLTERDDGRIQRGVRELGARPE
jgi:hypothetical protein